MSGSAPLQQHRTNCTRAHTAPPHITQHGANLVCSGKLCSGRAAPCRMGREANATMWGGGWRVLRFRAFSNFWGVISSRFGFVKTESTSNIAFSRTLIVWIQNVGNKRDISSGDLGGPSLFLLSPQVSRAPLPSCHRHHHQDCHSKPPRALHVQWGVLALGDVRRDAEAAAPSA